MESQTERKRRVLNFKELYNKGVVFITRCHNLSTGEPCEGTQLITLYNIKFPTKEQKFISKALENPAPEAIEWWQKNQNQLSREKYEQILKSMVIYEKSSLFESKNIKEQISRIRGDLHPYTTPIQSFFTFVYENSKATKRNKLFKEFFQRLNFDITEISEIGIDEFYHFLKDGRDEVLAPIPKKLITKDLILGFGYFVAKNLFGFKDGVEGIKYVTDKEGVGINFFFFDRVLKIFVGEMGVTKSSLLAGKAYHITNVAIESGLKGTGYGVRIYLTVMSEMDYLLSDMTLYTGSYRIWSRVLPKYCKVWTYFVDGKKTKVKKIMDTTKIDSKKIDRFIGSINNDKVIMK